MNYGRSELFSKICYSFDSTISPVSNLLEMRIVIIMLKANWIFGYKKLNLPYYINDK